MNVSKAGWLIAIAGATLAQLTGALPASAQSSPQVFFAPATPSAPLVASTAAGGEDRQVITVIEDGTSATITIVDGKVESASVDGKDVSTDRVRTRKDCYEILDDQGDVIATVKRLTVAGGGAAAGGLGLSASAPAARAGRTLVTTPSQSRYRVRGQAVAPAAPVPPAPPAPPMPGYVTIEDQPTPKVMIGVNLSEPDAALLGHFGLKPGEATMFSGVYQGLPAGSAGIGVYDIAVKVNGQSPAGPEDIRQVLRKLDPGDTVKFTILQHGQQRDVSVKVEPYSSERLSQAKVDAISAASDPFMGGAEQWRSFGGGGAHSLGHALSEEEMKKVMAEAELAAAKGGVDRLVGRLAPAPGQNADATVVPLLRLDEMRAREAAARAEAIEAAQRAEAVARSLADRAAQMEKRSVELKERSEKNADLEKRLDRLERMLERLLEEKAKDRP